MTRYKVLEFGSVPEFEKKALDLSYEGWKVHSVISTGNCGDDMYLVVLFEMEGADRDQ